MHIWGCEVILFGVFYQGDIRYVVCDSTQKTKNLLAKADQCPSLKCIIMMDSPSEELKSEAAKCKVELIQFKDFLVSKKRIGQFTVRNPQSLHQK